jgi:hypothetical protein
MYISFKDIYLGEILKSNTTGDTSGAETAYPSWALEFPPARSLVFYVVFYRSLFVVLPFFFGHCFVCSSLIYLFWLPLWYLQGFLTHKYLQYIVLNLKISNLMSVTPFWNKLHQMRPRSIEMLLLWSYRCSAYFNTCLFSCDASIL